MDKLTELTQEGGGGPVFDEPAPGMPPESPVPMPEQSADSFSRATRRPFTDPARSRSPRGPRLFVLGGASLLLAGAVYEMYRVLEPWLFFLRRLLLPKRNGLNYPPLSESFYRE